MWQVQLSLRSSALPLCQTQLPVPYYCSDSWHTLQARLSKEEHNRQDERTGRIRAEQRLKAAALELAAARESCAAPEGGGDQQLPGNGALLREPTLQRFSMRTIGFVESVFEARCAP